MTNSFLDQKYLVIHADDAGLSHSQNKAIMLSLNEGVVNSYSIMVPCPYFDEIAQFAIKHPEYDCGIHLTLSCEWKNYKFGPILPVSEVPSLVDDNGYFYASRSDIRKYAKPYEVELELRAQINKAIDLGINITHLDSHMYTLGLTSELLSVYKKLGREFNVPIFLDKTYLNEFGVDTKRELGGNDFCVDNTFLGEYTIFEKNLLNQYYQNVLKDLPNGFNVLLVHPAFDDDEMKSITIDHPNFGSEWRQIDYDFLNDTLTKELIRKNKIVLTTWREV